MSSVRTGALSRSIAALAFGNVERFYEDQRTRARESLAEYMQQFQVPVSGTLGGSIGWANLNVDFDVPMLRSPASRHAPFDKPTFTYGVYLQTGVDGIIVANVRKWVEDERSVNGALLRVGAYVPGAASETAFKATLHLTFQGLGAPIDDESDLDEPIAEGPTDFVIEETP